MFRSLIIFLLAAITAVAGSPPDVEWGSLPALPAAEGETEALGVAGPFVGTHNGALIVAGGANFPEGLPWEPKADGTNPPKIYHDRIYVMTKGADGAPSWQISDVKLPVKVGYGVSASTTEGVVCVGGHWKTVEADGSQKMVRSDRVFSIKWVDGKVQIDEAYPKLPSGWSDMAGGLVGSQLIIAGGDAGQGATNRCLSLDLTKKVEWAEKAPLPGEPRVLAVGAVQTVGKGKQLFVFSGRNTNKRGPEVLLSDSWRYNPSTNSWQQLADV